MVQCAAVRYSVAELLKTLGNNSFHEKDYERAVDYYLNAICVYRYLCPSRTLAVDETSLALESPVEGQELRSFMNVLFLNLTACYLELKEFGKALASIEESLKIDQSKDKAWFRKAKALEGTNDVKNLPGAINCLELAIKHSKTSQDETYFRKLLQDLNDKYITLRKNEQSCKGQCEASSSFKLDARIADSRKDSPLGFEMISDQGAEGVPAPHPLHLPK